MTPTKEQLDRYMDLMLEGQDAEDAIAVIWPDEPVKAKAPTVMLTEFPDGVAIGWDRCTVNNGGCGEPVAKCKCKGGPKEPRVFEEWRTGVKQMPEYGKTSAPGAPAVSRGVSKATTPVAAAAPTTPANSVACVLGKHFAPIDQADRNDDGTYSCFDCQEKGLQRGVQVDG